MTEKAKKAMDYVVRYVGIAVVALVSFLCAGHMSQEARLSAGDVKDAKQDGRLDTLEGRLDPVIRQIIHDEIERCVPPKWFLEQVQGMKQDLEALKKDVSEARQEIRGLHRP